jgi:hypothetical protein
MGERLERWSLRSLRGVGSLGSIVAPIDPPYLISDHMTSGLVPCAVRLAGVLAEWGLFLCRTNRWSYFCQGRDTAKEGILNINSNHLP